MSNQAKFTKTLVAALHHVADEIISNLPQQDYDATDETVELMNTLSSGLDQSNLNKVLKAREAYETGINKKWKVKFSKDPSVCFTQDLQAIMIKKNVPQRVRVTLGLFDTLVGQMNFGSLSQTQPDGSWTIDHQALTAMPSPLT